MAPLQSVNRDGCKEGKGASLSSSGRKGCSVLQQDYTSFNQSKSWTTEVVTPGCERDGVFMLSTALESSQATHSFAK